MARTLTTLAALTAAVHQCAASYVSSLPDNAQQLFNESMSWLDDYYDPQAGYLYDLSAQTALHHETRSSAWYAVGLLARDQGEDVKNAELIIRNVIDGQYKNPEEQWYAPCKQAQATSFKADTSFRYAQYQQEPEEPYVGSPAYPASIYGTFDANWRGFVGTTFIIALEEFGHLISDTTTRYMEESLKNATIGDSYRVGGVDGDNLYPAYSNPVGPPRNPSSLICR